MAKVIGICGSPRKESGSEFALKYALNIVERNCNCKTELITLSDKKIKRCTACGQCHTHKDQIDNFCIHNDDVGEIIKKLSNADGCIISSPVYLTTVPGILKDLLDRISIAMHTPGNNCNFKHNLRIGSAIVLGAVRNGGQETTLNTIYNCMLSLGYLITGGPCFELGKCENHSGVSIWSKDGSIATVKNDIESEKSLKYMAEHFALSISSLT